MYYNTASDNTASGYQALYTNTTGNDNVATGSGALYSNSTGADNAANGFQALYANTTGVNNTAFGSLALYSNTTGKGNAGQGSNALYSNTTGIRNLGIGNNALYYNNGSYNIGLGFDAGHYVTNGSNNIEIGNQGTAADNNTIQIGVQGTQTSTAIAGIFGTTVSGGMPVYVSSTGQLGVVTSSERFKTDIAPMPELSDRLQQLRPVTFTYKTDPKSVQQYGLIAEEVDKVYPELVIRDDKGKIQGVRYEELAPMLLNEIQKQNAEITQLKEQQKAFADLQRQLVELQAAIVKLQPKDQLVARR